MQESLHELDQVKVRHLMQSIYNLTMQPPEWNTMLQALCAATQAPRAYLIVEHGDTVHISTHSTDQNDAALYHAHCAGLHSKLSSHKLPTQNTLTSETNACIHTEVLHGIRNLHQTVFNVWSRDPLNMLWLGVNADPDCSTPTLCADRTAIITLAATHLATVLRVHTHTLATQSRRTHVSSALSCLPYAAVLIDKQSFIIEANACAEVTLNSDNLLQITPQRRLIAPKTSDQRRIQEAIASALQTQKTSMFTLTGGHPKKELQLKMIPSNQLLCVEVHPCAHRPISEIVERASTLYGVSAAERKVLCLLMDGMDAKEIALSVGLTIGTVNQYTHRIFSKLKVHKQRELICLLRDGMSSVL